MVHLPAVPDASEVEAGGWFKTRSFGGDDKKAFRHQADVPWVEAGSNHPWL